VIRGTFARDDLFDAEVVGGNVYYDVVCMGKLARRSLALGAKWPSSPKRARLGLRCRLVDRLVASGQPWGIGSNRKYPVAKLHEDYIDGRMLFN
jgi:hypothetical protein